LFSLKSYNTFGIEAGASRLQLIIAEDDILKLNWLPENPYKILGGGSNILITSDIEEPILKIDIRGIEIIEEHPTFCLVKAGAGVLWHEVVLWAIKNNLAGIENLSLIPGCAGAAPVQNIGAYGVEIKDVIESVEGVYIPEMEKRFFSNASCCFEYRNSIFKSTLKNKFIITGIILKLQKNAELNISYGSLRDELQKNQIEHPHIKDVSAAVIRIRKSKLPDPSVLGNAGSFFKNYLMTNERYHELKIQYPDLPSFIEDDKHVKIPAGWLIEKCGWKGFRRGDAGCYEKQALVLVNYGKASGREILELANEISESVFKAFDVRLNFEVNIW
jgi:UDP-N-acetylmuramate dehydrogenase